MNRQTARLADQNPPKQLFYESFADEFDERMNQYDLQVRLDIVFQLLLPPSISGMHLLDAGCGTGHFSQRACSKGAIVTSLDMGENLLRQVAAKCDSRRVVGSVLDMDFENDAFDCIICSEVIEHTEDPFAAIRQLHRVLRPGGVLALTVPNRFWKWSCVVANSLRLRPYKGFENWVGYFRLRRVLEDTGFAVQRYIGFHLFPFQLAWTQPLLRKLDKFGNALGALYINIAASCTKSGHDDPVRISNGSFH